ncbi:MAG: response regulator [Burkholderiaceae bacterium]
MGSMFSVAGEVAGGQRLLNILHVEDDEIDVEAFSRGMRDCSFEHRLHHACDGRVALDMLRGVNGQAMVDKPRIVLLDLNMPRMSGFEFLEEVSRDESLRSLVVFVLSTSTRDLDIARSYRHGIAGYIGKDALARNFMPLLALLDSYNRLVSLPA